mmetsp:Transcript_24188/g.52645  ORF Transcript_24188/g.52645 Transcript_24188/m.52645 type:complete len:85 (+) Transcript_24188:688-942(+)
MQAVEGQEEEDEEEEEDACCATSLFPLGAFNGNCGTPEETAAEERPTSLVVPLSTNALACSANIAKQQTTKLSIEGSGEGTMSV